METSNIIIVRQLSHIIPNLTYSHLTCTLLGSSTQLISRDFIQPQLRYQPVTPRPEYSTKTKLNSTDMTNMTKQLIVTEVQTPTNPEKHKQH